jgi:hypothetical protein
LNPSRKALSQIPGRYIVEAMDRLPPSGPKLAAEQLEIDVPLWGRFRITFKSIRQRRGGLPPRWVWVAAKAESLDVGKSEAPTLDRQPLIKP